MKKMRLTQPSLKILTLFLRDARKQKSGAEISKALKIMSGTMYPILFRLEEAGWLESEWEKIDPSEAGRPRKRLYRLTAVGKQQAKAALDELRTT
jgi:PadR family transcriptional regulator PadR